MAWYPHAKQWQCQVSPFLVCPTQVRIQNMRLIKTKVLCVKNMEKSRLWNHWHEKHAGMGTGYNIIVLSAMYSFTPAYKNQGSCITWTLYFLSIKKTAHLNEGTIRVTHWVTNSCFWRNPHFQIYCYIGPFKINWGIWWVLRDYTPLEILELGP